MGRIVVFEPPDADAGICILKPESVRSLKQLPKETFTTGKKPSEAPAGVYAIKPELVQSSAQTPKEIEFGPELLYEEVPVSFCGVVVHEKMRQFPQGLAKRPVKNDLYTLNPPFADPGRAQGDER